jgi:hypothetical protein
MKRKRLILAFALFAGLVVAALGIGYALLPTGHGITRADTDRIQIGMTAAEVEAVLGMPPGFYRADMDRKAPARQKHQGIVRADNDKVITAAEVMFWYVEEAAIYVYLDENARVVWCDAYFHSPTTRLMRQFGWLRLPGKW